MKVGPIAGKKAGSSKGKSGVGRYSLDYKGTRNERDGMSGGGDEEDEDLGILYCDERSHDSNLRWWSLNSIHTGQAAHRLYKLRTLVEFALVKDHV